MSDSLPTEEVTEAAPPPAAVVEPGTELRLLVYALFAAVFLVSVSLNLFMYKQNSRVRLEVENANAQAGAIEQNPMLTQNRNAMQNLLRDLAAQIPAHPEAEQILARYNISVQQAPPAAGTPPPAAAPTAPAAQ